MGAPYKPRKPGSLKQAVAHLVERCGGQTVVAPLWKCTAQNVARMTDDGHKALPRLDQILAAEARCNDPIVTRYMAGELNCIVEPVHCDSSAPLPMILGNLTSEMGELLSAAALAIGSGRMSRTNAANVLRETEEVVCALIQLRGECREVLDEGHS